jgi:hypothetical protein
VLKEKGREWTTKNALEAIRAVRIAQAPPKIELRMLLRRLRKSRKSDSVRGGRTGTSGL